MVPPCSRTGNRWAGGMLRPCKCECTRAAFTTVSRNYRLPSKLEVFVIHPCEQGPHHEFKLTVWFVPPEQPNIKSVVHTKNSLLLQRSSSTTEMSWNATRQSLKPKPSMLLSFVVQTFLIKTPTIKMQESLQLDVPPLNGKSVAAEVPSRHGSVHSASLELCSHASSKASPDWLLALPLCFP